MILCAFVFSLTGMLIALLSYNVYMCFLVSIFCFVCAMLGSWALDVHWLWKVLYAYGHVACLQIGYLLGLAVGVFALHAEDRPEAQGQLLSESGSPLRPSWSALTRLGIACVLAAGAFILTMLKDPPKSVASDPAATTGTPADIHVPTGIPTGN